MMSRCRGNRFAWIIFGGFLSIAVNLPAQNQQGTLYINDGGMAVQIMSTPVVPNPPPASVIRTLQPGQQYYLQPRLGAAISFQTTNGGRVVQERRTGSQGPYIALLAIGRPNPPTPRPQGQTYLNRTGETVDQYEQAPPSIPPQPSRYVRSLQPNETWTDGPTRVSPLEWRLRSGGQLQLVQEERADGSTITAIVKTGNPTPNPTGTTYVNRSNETIDVMEQRGVTNPPSPPSFLQQLFPGQSYTRSGPQVSPLVFRMASGGSVQRIPEPRQPGNPNRIVGLNKKAVGSIGSPVETLPGWVNSPQGIPGGVGLVAIDPNNPTFVSNIATGLLSAKEGRNFSLVKVRYYGKQSVNGTNHYLVMNMKERSSGQIGSWDLKVFQDPEDRFRLVSSSKISQSNVVPDTGGYRRPSWVDAQNVPGGIIKQDANSFEAKSGAQSALSMLRNSNRGFQGATLERVLHYGTQATWPDTNSYFVVRVFDRNGQSKVWELKLTRSQNGFSQVSANTLN